MLKHLLATTAMTALIGAGAVAAQQTQQTAPTQQELGQTDRPNQAGQANPSGQVDQIGQTNQQGTEGTTQQLGEQPAQPGQSAQDAPTAQDAQSAQTGMEPMAVERLVGMSVIDGNDETIGTVDQVVARNDELFIVVGAGGFLGIGERDVAIPLDRVSLRGEELVLATLTQAEIEQMRDAELDGYQPVQAGREAELRLHAGQPGSGQGAADEGYGTGQ